MIAVARQKQTWKNERRACRFSITLPASYLIYNNWYECEIVDACTQGVAIKTKQFFMVDDTLKLRITFEDRAAVIETKVTYHNGPKTGIVFSNYDGKKVVAFLDILDAALNHQIKHQARDYFRNMRG